MPIFADHDLRREFLGYCGDREPSADLAGRFVQLIAEGRRDANGTACAASARLVLQSRLASTAFFSARRADHAGGC